jgi:hypothetical protein
MSLQETLDDSNAQSLVAPPIGSEGAVMGSTGPPAKRNSDEENMPPDSENGGNPSHTFNKLPPGVSLMMGKSEAKQESPASNATAPPPQSNMTPQGAPESSEVVQAPVDNDQVRITVSLI